MSTEPTDPPQPSGINIERAQVNTGGGDIVGGDKHVTINQGARMEDLEALFQRFHDAMPMSALRGVLSSFDVDSTTLDIGHVQAALEQKAREYQAMQQRLANVDDSDPRTAFLRQATMAALDAGDFTGADASLSLTETAQELAALNQAHNEQMTSAARQLADAPLKALPLVQLSLSSAENIEARELAFLGRMGEFGVQQQPQAKAQWLEQYLQLQLMQAQAYAMLGRWPSVRKTLDVTRTRVGDRPIPEMAKNLFDQLSMACTNMGA